MRPTVAVVAADEPETAANSAQPRILTCSNPPGSRRVKGDSPVNRSEDSRERNRISPIQMNIGSAVRSQTFKDPQIFVARIDPVGAPVASSIATIPTARSARTRPRGRAAARPNSTTRRMIDSVAISISPDPASPSRARSAARKAGSAPRRVVTSSSISATVKIIRPDAITVSGSRAAPRCARRTPTRRGRRRSRRGSRTMSRSPRDPRRSPARRSPERDCRKARTPAGPA